MDFYFFPWNPGTATVQLPSPAEAEHSRQRPVQPPNVHRQPGQPPGARHQQKWWGLQIPRIPRNWELQWSFTSLWWRNPCSVSGFPPGALGKDLWKSTSVFSLKNRVFFSIPCPAGLCPVGNRNVRPLFHALRNIPLPKWFRAHWAHVRGI